MSADISQAVQDVVRERARQIENEGWSEAHDNEHDAGELAAAGCSYAWQAADRLHPQSQGDGRYHLKPPPMWPWRKSWWKSTTPRRDLVKAAALLLAEIERGDRMGWPA